MILLTGSSGRLATAVIWQLAKHQLAWRAGDSRNLTKQDFAGINIVIDLAAGMTPGRMCYHTYLAKAVGAKYIMASSLLVTEYEQGKLINHKGAARKFEVENVLINSGVWHYIVRLPPIYYGFGLHSRLVMILRSWYRGRSWRTPVSVEQAASLIMEKV